jgi:hypothetical protein
MLVTVAMAVVMRHMGPVMVPGRGAGGGRTQHGKREKGGDKGFHCDLQNG